LRAVLLIDFGSTFTKVTAVDVEGGEIIGTAKAFTTLEPGIHVGLEKALINLREYTGQVEYSRRLACSSAAGGLKMIAVGLVPELTAEAAKKAALSAGAKVMKVYSYELNREEAEEIGSLKPDILLLTGGTDGGNRDVILHNAWMISAIGHELSVVVAGNKSVAEDVAAILNHSGKHVNICDNVMPEFNVLNIEPARYAIRNIFLKRIIYAKGLTRIQEVMDEIMMPTPSAVLNAARLLSTGYGTERGMGDLMVVDVGGATTDVYSIAAGNPTRSGIMVKGLPEPFAKRTVEGDLGVRYSAFTLTEVVGLDNISSFTGLSPQLIKRYITRFTQCPGLLPKNDGQMALVDYGLACAAVKTSVERHVGQVEIGYSVSGITYIQSGKDLSDTKVVIGTGGVVVNSSNCREVLQQSAFDMNHSNILKPKSPELFIDERYIMAAMGLLAEHYPETAIRILKKEIKAVV
jgi:uncharacterized protein (TIGR01319 family)